MSQPSLKLQALRAFNGGVKWIDSQVEEANKTKQGKAELLALSVLGKGFASGIIYGMSLPIALAYEGVSHLVDKGITKLVAIDESTDVDEELVEDSSVLDQMLLGVKQAGRNLASGAKKVGGAIKHAGESALSSVIATTLWYDILESDAEPMVKANLLMAAVFRAITWRVFQTDKVDDMTKVLALKLAKVAITALILKSFMLISAYTFSVILVLNLTVLPLLYAGSILMQKEESIPGRIKFFKPDSFTREVLKTLLLISQASEESSGSAQV